MNLTRDEVRAICRAYSLLKVRLKAHELRRKTILQSGGTSIMTVEGRRAGPGDPTAAKVQALEHLERNYFQSLKITWAIEECLKAMGKESEKVFKLYFENGLTVREVAQKMRLTKSSVHRRIAKILDTVAYWLTREEDTKKAALHLLKTL